MPAPAAAPPLTPEQIRTAMASPQKLIDWLRETGREYIVLRAEDLVRSQAWPEGVDAFIHIVGAYRDYRSTQPSGAAREVTDARGGRQVVSEYKTDRLTDDEIRACISQLNADLEQRACA